MSCPLAASTLEPRRVDRMAKADNEKLDTKIDAARKEAKTDIEKLRTYDIKPTGT